MQTGQGFEEPFPGTKTIRFQNEQKESKESSGLGWGRTACWSPTPTPTLCDYGGGWGGTRLARLEEEWIRPPAAGGHHRLRRQRITPAAGAQHSLRSIGLAKTPPQPPPQPPPQRQPNPVQTHRPRPPKPVEKQQKDRLTLAATPTPGVVQAPQQQRQRPLGRPQPCFQCPYQEQKAKSSSSEPPSPMPMPSTFPQTSP